ncbi:MAG: DMT family transporter [Gemmatimonadaceae bacterium]|nr:DMT family transporter [Gemmatimonadaceae bacterium]
MEANVTTGPHAPRANAALVLAFAVFGIAWAAPLIRLASAPPLIIAGWRLVIAEAVLLLVLVWRRDWRAWQSLARRDHLLAAGAGGMLALHFWSWNASLSYTTVAASVVLVNLQPAIVAAGSVWLLHEPASRRQVIGLTIGILGALLVAAPAMFGSAPADRLATTAPFGLPPRIFGDLLALIGAITAALYYLVGRRLRARLDLVPYVTLVYGWCTLALFALALARGDRLGPYPASDWAIFAGLAAGPMLLGHTGMNWALKHLPAHVVNLTVLGEPVGASILAMLIPAIGERPDLWTIVGGALILGGAVWAMGQPSAGAGRRGD